MAELYFQKGLGLKAEVGPVLVESYGSAVVDRVRDLGFAVRAGDITIRLAKEFGFCYGVDRAVDYAYQTRQRFPDRRIFLSGEIIHNPEVNGRLRSMGIRILEGPVDPVARYEGVGAADVVLLPAFGVPVGELAHLKSLGCVVVDTTCGSVLNVWKNVQRYAREGFTAVIHGKHYHEETRATASQMSPYAGGQYLCVRNKPEAELVCAFIRGQLSAADLMAQLGEAAGPGFDPDRDLQKIGLANQTTMLMSESLEIQGLLRAAMKDRWGEAELATRFRAFDTICSATQERQDAVHELLARGGLDVIVVVGGYNSSNTIALARMCTPAAPTYHVDGATSFDADQIRHRPLGATEDVTVSPWLPPGPLVVGLTAGASTPNNVVGEVIRRLLATRGRSPEDLVAEA